MANFSPSQFSANGDKWIHSNQDGIIRLWDTFTGSLKQEYTPSSHLSASCTCLSWGPIRKKQLSKPKKIKKRLSDAGDNAEDLGLVAIGTKSGNVLLYSTTKGDLHSQLTDGHTASVTDICWKPDGDSLYTSSCDCNIIEWSSSNKVIHKWKGDKSTVNAVCLVASRHLLSAGRSIKLWDLEKREVIQMFTGHATEVSRLLLVNSSISDDSPQFGYFLSSAKGDRIINAWQINTASKDKNAIASFSLPDEAVMLNISKQSSKEQPILLCVVTRNGRVLLFEHTLNGRCRVPLQPKFTVHITTPSSKEITSRPVPVLASSTCDDPNNPVLIVYGNYVKPSFERIPYDRSKQTVKLSREVYSQTRVKSLTEATSIKTPAVSKDVTLLAPKDTAPKSRALELLPQKARKRKTSEAELTMEERLSAISFSGDSSSRRPKTDTLAKLLVQGLQSCDMKMLNNVLQTRDMEIVKNTVKKLPISVVIPFVHQLSKRMYNSTQSAQLTVKWLKTVLTVHTSYLMTFPEIVEIFDSLYQMMESRTSSFKRLSRLQGKLDLILSQVAAQTEGEEEQPKGVHPPLLMYQDESSDESDLMDVEHILHSPADSEEDWENVSDEDDTMEGNDVSDHKTDTDSDESEDMT